MNPHIAALTTRLSFDGIGLAAAGWWLTAHSDLLSSATLALGILLAFDAAGFHFGNAVGLGWGVR